MIADMGNSEPDTQDQVGHQRDTVQVDAPSDHDPEEGRKATKREDYDESHSPKVRKEKNVCFVYSKPG